MARRLLGRRGLTPVAVVLVLSLVVPSGPVWPATASASDEVGVTTSMPPASEEPTLPPAPAETRLELSAPAICAAKATVTVTARLLDAAGRPIGGRRLLIERLGASVTVLGTGLTDSSGRFSLTMTPRWRAKLRAQFAGDAEYAKSTSPVAVVMPKVLLSKPWTHDTIAYPGQRLPARGTLWPKHSSKSIATTIRCERYESGKWVLKVRYRATTVNTSSGSRYRAVIKLPSAGRWRVRAEHRDVGHAKTLGPSTYVRVTDWRRRYVGGKIGGFANTQKMVAITIDDGPNHRTLDFCRVLERYGAKGTFFFTRRLLLNGYLGQAGRVYDRGHEVANHTANHKMLIGSYSRSYYEANAPIAVIRRATGFDPIWIRAMGGGIDVTGMRAVVNTGQLYCNWSVDSYDSHRSYTPPSTLYRNVVGRVRAGDVILIHQTHAESLQALPSICAELKRRGYKMVTLSELAAKSTRR
jgi:peptidoglycan/xylan/chitin deacetylase (PgdA/CDA1 family)